MGEMNEKEAQRVVVDASQLFDVLKEANSLLYERKEQREKHYALERDDAALERMTVREYKQLCSQFNFDEEEHQRKEIILAHKIMGHFRTMLIYAEGGGEASLQALRREADEMPETD